MARLTVNAKLDKSRFPINMEATAEEMVSVNLESHARYEDRARPLGRADATTGRLPSDQEPAHLVFMGRPSYT